MSLTPLDPLKAAQLLDQGRAILVDVREAHEFAEQRAAGAISRPLSTLGRQRLDGEPGKAVIFTCLSGMRTTMNAARLAGSVDSPSYVLKGGLNAWSRAGLPVEQKARRPALRDLLFGRAGKD